MTLHSFEDCQISAVQIDQNVAGISIVRVGLDVDVTSLAVTTTQNSYRCRMHPLRSRPEPFSREWPPGLVMNQTDQIQIVRMAANWWRIACIVRKIPRSCTDAILRSKRVAVQRIFSEQ
ncbi:MAG: hypothetical protein DMG57_30225 [Acidobacteria bacterium]|nr:MAG: hypothetical protein DMG57_30225 [Acidobacteriota bacterium]